MARQRLTDEAREELARWLPYLSKCAARVLERTGLSWDDALSLTYESAVYVAGTWDRAKGAMSTILFKYVELTAVNTYHRERAYQLADAKQLHGGVEPWRSNSGLAAVDAADEVEHVSQSVPPREWRMMLAYYGEGLTYQQVAKREGRSVERIRQLCERGLRMAQAGGATNG